MQHFDNLDEGRNDFANSSHYTEEDFDDYYITNPKKPYYVDELLQHRFDYTDADGEEQQLYTEVQVLWEVVYGSYSYDAPSDMDFNGYSELQEWSVRGHTDSYGEVTSPEEVLTPEQFQEYTLDLIKFIEG